jgi:hypothetical protein
MIRNFIFQFGKLAMVTKNPNWLSPSVHGSAVINSQSFVMLATNVRQGDLYHEKLTPVVVCGR